MSSHAQKNCFHKLKNPKRQDEDSGGVNLTPCNPSKPQSSRTLFAPARRNRKQPSSSDRDQDQELTLEKTSMKLFV